MYDSGKYRYTVEICCKMPKYRIQGETQTQRNTKDTVIYMPRAGYTNNQSMIQSMKNPRIATHVAIMEKPIPAPPQG